MFGVLLVPGLYYVFGTLAEGRSLIRDEEDTSMTEDVVRHSLLTEQVRALQEEPTHHV